MRSNAESAKDAKDAEDTLGSMIDWEVSSLGESEKLNNVTVF
jgi:hypothetical protein